MSLESALNVAKPASKSLRATVPEAIVHYLELTAGDRLDWRMDFQDGKRIAIVRKVLRK